MTSSGFSILSIDAGNLPKPANTLVKCISKAIGGLYEPKRIVQKAEAEAKAKLIGAQADIAVSELQQRAAQRSSVQEARFQQNFEEILGDALPHLDDEAKPEAISDDWYMNFFDKARLVSDDQMRTLWSKILAGEANDPGSYSRRTVNFVDNMDKDEAELFTRLCGFIVSLKNWQPLIFDENHEIYGRNGINYERLALLDSIGLIRFNSLSNLTLTTTQPRGRVDYYDRTWILEFGNSDNRDLKVGKATLTSIGQELTPISGSQPVQGFAEYVMKQWEKHSPKEITQRDVSSSI